VDGSAAPVADVFPLVPRRPLRGLEIGPFRSVRRGTGSDPAGSRPYEPGDDVRLIDWGASARLSAAAETDEFVVRERFAEQAPRVVVLSDRRPAMALHPPPWLSKPRALARCEELIGESALRARGLVGGLHFEGLDACWSPPSGNPRAWRARRSTAGFTAAEGLLGDGILRLAQLRALPAGSFLFVLSDFLDPVPDDAWLEARARDWDVVPVVIQDPTWESSFPVELGGLVVPLARPGSTEHRLVRVSRREARAIRARHESRLAGLLHALADLGLDPVTVLGDHPEDVLSAFVSWAASRLVPAGRAW
jgi:uncharacterized protein (DUF58 family)